MLGFIKDSPQSRRYLELANRIAQALGFMRACGLDLGEPPELKTTDFSAPVAKPSIAALRASPNPCEFHSGDWYCTSGHLVWIGDRTRQPDHAHVEFARGIHNPIGLKCGPSFLSPTSCCG